MFEFSGFKRTLCGGAWESTKSNNKLTNTGRLGCCPSASFMLNPEVSPFSVVSSCSLCPNGQSTSSKNDETSCLQKLPDGNGQSYLSSRTGDTINRIVDDYLDVTKRPTIVAKYGEIENWDVSDVTNMKALFYGKDSFNSDLSKWITSKATDMGKSECLAASDVISSLFMMESCFIF